MDAQPSRDISYFAKSNFRNRNTPIGIRQFDRLSHVYVIGKTGVGKSTLLETLALQDLAAGRGFALIDPHGDLVESIAANIPAKHQSRVVYLDATDPAQPFGYNPLRRVRHDKIPLAVSGLLETLRKLWPDAWGVRMEHVLRNSLYALLERDGSTLPDILQLYSDEDYRKAIVADIRNETVRRFWQDEFEHYPPRLRAELRKYGIGLTLAHQYLAQLDSDIRSAVIGNAGTLISFRVGAEDSPFLAREFLPQFDAQDILGLPNHSIYLRLMIDGTPSMPFSGDTFVFDRPKISA